MVLHLANEHPDRRKTDARFVFRRKKERTFLRNFLGAQVVVFIIFLAGIGLSITNLKHEYNHLHDKAVLARADVAATNEKLEVAYETIQGLVDRQREGYRFTAGNSWQMAQMILSGEVDMKYFPDYDLKYPDKTWFHGWLRAHGYLVESNK